MLRSPFVALLLLMLLGLAGCGALPTSNANSIDFEDIFENRGDEDEYKLEKTVKLDTDDDGEEEWLVLYRYDPYKEAAWANTPIQGIVYDVLPCDPPAIHSWQLPTPDSDYLGEGETNRVFMEDWLSSTDNREREQELVIYGQGPANTLSIYRFHNYQANYPCAPLEEAQQGYSLLGFFRANGRIEWEADPESGDPTVITTYQRTLYERSQLAIKSLYAPRVTAAGESFIGDDGKMIAPQEQTVAFMFGMPKLAADSPYPEKAVATFFLALGEDNELAKELLTEDMRNIFDDTDWGLDVRPADLNRVLIYSITYTPDREAELTHLEREVSVVVAPVDANNQRLPARRLTWLVRGFVEEGKSVEDCEWRLAQLLQVDVTPGLGQQLPRGGPLEGVALVP